MADVDLNHVVCLAYCLAYHDYFCFLPVLRWVRSTSYQGCGVMFYPRTVEGAPQLSSYLNRKFVVMS
mgnify:CR=1